MPLFQRADDFNVLQLSRFLGSRLVQPGKGLFLFAEEGIVIGDLTGIYISPLGELLLQFDFSLDRRFKT